MKRSKVITIIISVVTVICLCVAVTFVVKSINGKKSANEITSLIPLLSQRLKAILTLCLSASLFIWTKSSL